MTVQKGFQPDTSDLLAEEEQLLTNLRASDWNEFWGQEKIKQSLEIAIKAALTRKEPLEHVLLYGPPGLGKTTLAHLIAKKMGGQIRVTSGPAIERAGDLAAILTSLQAGDVLFIDEIHRLNSVVEETLYPAMEDFALDIIVGKGPSAKTLRLDLPAFTIVGATTRVGLLSSPLRDRFGMIHRLNFYEKLELLQILEVAAKKLKVKIDKDPLDAIATRSRGTPRIALRLLKRIRDIAQVSADGLITPKLLSQAFTLLEVDHLGLDASDRRLLLALMDIHQGGPVGLETLAATISEDKGTLEEVIEPYLLQIGFLKRTPRGRIATQNAFAFFKKQVPQHLVQLNLL